MTEQPTQSTQPTDTSLLEVLAYYAEAGFDGDAFASDDGLVLCGSCGSKVSPDHVSVHSIRRLEGASDPSDMLGVLAVICPVCGKHSTCVLKYGPEVSPEEAAVWRRTEDLRHSDQLPANMAPGEDDPAVQPFTPEPQ